MLPLILAAAKAVGDWNEKTEGARSSARQGVADAFTKGSYKATQQASPWSAMADFGMNAYAGDIASKAQAQNLQAGDTYNKWAKMQLAKPQALQGNVQEEPAEPVFEIDPRYSSWLMNNGGRQG